MTSLRELIETTRHALSGFDTSKEAVLELAETINSSALSIPVDDVGATSGAARGLAEIDLEVVRVKSVDSSAVSLELNTFGRGYRGTTAASHTAGAEVRMDPSWPASTIAREINGVLTEIYPQIYVIKDHETSFPSEGGAIDLPEDAVGVIGVYTEDRMRSSQWIPESRWSFNKNSSTTGKALRVGGSLRVGEDIRVIYAARPVLFNLGGALTQDFATVTGLPDRTSDLVRLGVAARMAPYFDLARLPVTAAVARFDGESRGPSAGANAVRILDALYKRRLADEASVLVKENPIKLHYTGRT